MNTLRLILGFMCASLIIACDSKSSDSSSGDPKPVSEAGKAKLAQLEANGVKNQNFRLRSDLSFVDADRAEFKAMEGTSMETPMVRYVFAFNNQRRMTAADVDAATSFCAVFIETTASTPVTGVAFHAQEKLLKGEFQTSSHNADMNFAIQLQGARLQSFFLSCKNVTSVDQIDAHIGHLIQIF